MDQQKAANSYSDSFRWLAKLAEHRSSNSGAIRGSTFAHWIDQYL